MSQLPNNITLSTDRLAEMSLEDMTEFTHIINNVLNDVGTDNLYMTLFRYEICKWLETIFISEDFKFTIDVDENSQLYGQITSKYDGQRRERKKEGQPVADRRYIFSGHNSLVKYFTKAFTAYKEEVKYYNKHNKESKNNNNITIMKKNSKKQVNLATTNANENVATSIVDVLRQISSLPTGISVDVTKWFEDITNGRIVSTIENGTIAFTIRKGITTCISIAELVDEDYYEDVKNEFLHLLERADRMNSSKTVSTPAKEEVKVNIDKDTSVKTEEPTMTEDEKKKFNDFFCSDEGQKILAKKLDGDDFTLQSLASKMIHSLKEMSKDLKLPVLSKKQKYIEIMNETSLKYYNDFLNLAA